MSYARSTILALGIVGASTIGAHARDLGDINRTQSSQIQQIEQARRSGQLTRREYSDLKAEQARITRQTESAERDGVVTGREHRSIREAQREAGANVYAESHDNQVSWLRRWKWGHGYRN